MRPQQLVAVALVVVPGLACGPGPGRVRRRGARTAEIQAQPPQQRPTITSHMHTSLALIDAARHAVILGDIETARARGDALLDASQYRDLPRDWRPWIERVRRASAALSSAPDLQAAAQAVASVGLACGDCHWVSGRGPRMPEPAAAPPPSVDLPGRMARHRAASDEMWMGLLQPSDRLWRMGTETFAAPELLAPYADAQRQSAEVTGLSALAAEARMAVTNSERAERYAAIVARCGGCHRVARPHPASP